MLTLDINEFLTMRYDDIVKMTEKITQDSNHREIAHYVIEQFMLHERAQELIDKDEAMKFMSGIIYRNYKSTSSPYHKIFRQKGRVHATNELYPFESTPLDDEYDYETDLLLDAVEGILEDMHADKDSMWYYALLFQMYLETPNYSELERKTKIPRTSISNAVNEAIRYIKLKLKENGITD